MKNRIYETDFDGNPVECTGDFFSGTTALDIVNVMNPLLGRQAGKVLLFPFPELFTGKYHFLSGKNRRMNWIFRKTMQIYAHGKERRRK